MLMNKVEYFILDIDCEEVAKKVTGVLIRYTASSQGY